MADALIAQRCGAAKFVTHGEYHHDAAQRLAQELRLARITIDEERASIEESGRGIDGLGDDAELMALARARAAQIARIDAALLEAEAPRG